MGPLSVKMSRSLILLLPLALLLFCCLFLSNFDMIFVLSEYMLLCYVLLLSPRSLCFLMKDRREVVPDEKGGGE